MIVGKDGVIARTGGYVVDDAEDARLKKIEAAAQRVSAELDAAKEGGYLSNGWYSYIDRHDIETLVQAAR